MKIYDVSTGLRSGMYVYPGDPEFHKTPLRSGESYISALSLGTHTGTHIDAPSHYFQNGKTIDRIGFENLIMHAEVVTSPHFPSKKCPAILFKNAVPLSREIAEKLLRNGVKTIGCDSLSIGNDEVHRLLLKEEVVIIEMLDLSKISDGVYRMIALPLKIEEADASPARVVLLDDVV
jgi:arylformamidase